LDWRRKLGGMLIRELGAKEHTGPGITYPRPSFRLCRKLMRSQDKASILHDLPENYRLYEHIKSKAPQAGGESKPTKNHAGGGHDRQDAYLYGHPLGRKKRFRSPADFFPHLLWLATDPDGDRGNCTCKICSPEEFQPDEPKEVKP